MTSNWDRLSNERGTRKMGYLLDEFLIRFLMRWVFSLDGFFVGWVTHWMVYSVDGLPVGWVTHWMGYLLDGFIVGWVILIII